MVAAAAVCSVATACSGLGAATLSSASPKTKAARYVLRPVDLPPGWKQLPSDASAASASRQADAHAVACLDPEANLQLSGNTRSVDAPVFQSADRRETLSSSIDIPKSAGKARALFRLLESPLHLRCLSMAFGAAYAKGEDGLTAKLVDTKVVSIPSPLDDSVDTRLTFTYTKDGAKGTIYIDLVAEGDSHAIASFSLVDVALPGDIPAPDEGTVGQVADAVGRRILGQ
jgi:hypothetical protein